MIAFLLVFLQIRSDLEIPKALCNGFLYWQVPYSPKLKYPNIIFLEESRVGVRACISTVFDGHCALPPRVEHNAEIAWSHVYYGALIFAQKTIP